MSSNRHRWLQRPWTWLLLGVTLGLVALQSSLVFLSPVVRETPAKPVYAVCQPETIDQLAVGEDVVVWGRIPLGIYHGQRAFASARQALQHLQQKGMLSKGYAVYQLSGDFAEDTYQVGDRHFIRHTLRVTERVAPNLAHHIRTLRR